MLKEFNGCPRHGVPRSPARHLTDAQISHANDAALRLAQARWKAEAEAQREAEQRASDRLKAMLAAALEPYRRQRIADACFEQFEVRQRRKRQDQDVAAAIEAQPLLQRLVKRFGS